MVRRIAGMKITNDCDLPRRHGGTEILIIPLVRKMLRTNGNKLADYFFTAQRNFAERARGFVWHSSAEGRIGSGATSL